MEFGFHSMILTRAGMALRAGRAGDHDAI